MSDYIEHACPRCGSLLCSGGCGDAFAVIPGYGNFMAGLSEELAKDPEWVAEINAAAVRFREGLAARKAAESKS